MLSSSTYCILCNIFSITYWLNYSDWLYLLTSDIIVDLKSIVYIYTIYNLILLNTSLYTTLSVLLLFQLCSGRSTEIFNAKVHLENATWSCPYKNTDICKLIPICSTDCPWDLLIVIAKASLTENWSLLSGTGNMSVLGNNLILGINITFPLNLLLLLIILYYSTFLLIFNTTILVLL